MLHVVAIWQGLAQYTDRIGAVSAHVDSKRGEERLTIEVFDVCASQLDRVVAALNQSSLPMAATVEPIPVRDSNPLSTERPQAPHPPQSSRGKRLGTPHAPGNHRRP